MASLRQKRAAQKVVENGRNKKPKSKGKILKEAGYSKPVSEQPQKVFDSKGFKEEAKPFLDQLITKRQEAIDQLTKGKLTKANARDTAHIVDILTRNIQLLGGKPTDIVKVDAIFAKISGDTAGIPSEDGKKS